MQAINWLFRHLFLGIVWVYRYMISPLTPGSCRFTPTCSAYALEALERHGAAAGSALTVGRLARCHPWCAGGHDPVPAERPRLFSRLLSRQPSRPSHASTPPHHD